MTKPADGHKEAIENNFLGKLSQDDLNLLKPYLQTWRGQAGQVIYEPGDVVQYVYFPCGPSLVSYLVVVEDGRAIETVLIGNEGAIGGIVSHGRLPAFTRSEVQYAGAFLRMTTADLEAAKHQSLSLRLMFTRYADCVMAQIFQSVACNAVHSIEQRAAKWLLGVTSRTRNKDVSLTQEQLSAMLGVGRTYLSRVLSTLRQKGLVEGKRGAITIRSFTGLKAISCRCDESVHNHFEEVLSGLYPEPTPPHRH